MPVMDGFTLWDHMRAMDPELKVCFMTARSEDELLKIRLQDRPRVCVAKKPIHVRDLVLLLRAELDIKNSEANAA
jgi:CheY-like chemotaxis protein